MDGGTDEQNESRGTVTTTQQNYDFFFYGTLCIPAILSRVLGRTGNDLTFQDALLPGYTRHCVKGEDYPAVADRDQTAQIMPNSAVLVSEEVNTRGTLVKGLSFDDIHALDVFEGTQYSRKRLTVRNLTPPSKISALPPALSQPSTREPMDTIEAQRDVSTLQDAAGVGAGEQSRVEKVEGKVELGEEEAWVYVWSDDVEGLEPQIWSFEQFMKDKAHVWAGQDLEDFQEVEWHRRGEKLVAREIGKARATVEDDGGEGDGDTIEGRKLEGYPDFGHGMLKYWNFWEGYVHLNHGSYGSPPRPVIKAMRDLSDQIEGCPDYFHRRTWLPLLNRTRSQLAKMIGASMQEVVLVPNATHGINTVVNNIQWQEGDVIVTYSTSYGAVSQMMKGICDKHPTVSLEVIDLTFPCPHAEVVSKTGQTLEKYNTLAKPSYTGESRPTGKHPDKRVRMVVVDSIASNPGVVLPWEDVVEECKRYGVLSLVDAAHSIGQQKVDVKRADCDFLVSNCHKWLMSHRGGALMYIPLRNQHLIRSSFPTSAGYESTRYPTEGINRQWSFEKQYEWTGTQDWTPFLSISPAIEFRRSIGGEERIMTYCHSLAVLGGKRLRSRWGTEVMENPTAQAGQLIAAMVNVALPDIPSPANLEEQFRQHKFLEDEQFANNVYSGPYRHGGRWWARFSAQVWNELGDFDRIGEVFESICERMRRGEHNQVENPAMGTVHGAEDLPTQDE